MKPDPEEFSFSDHDKAVWAARVLATHKHRECTSWVVETREQFNQDGTQKFSMEVMPRDRLQGSRFFDGLTPDEAFAIARMYAQPSKD